MANEFVLTKKGKQDLEAQLEYLKTVKRAEISEQIKVARSFGDLSENAEYTEARNEQSRIEGKIQSLESTLRMATIVDDDEVNLEKVSIGTKVRLLDQEFDEEEAAGSCRWAWSGSPALRCAGLRSPSRWWPPTRGR